MNPNSGAAPGPAESQVASGVGDGARDPRQYSLEDGETPLPSPILE